MVDSGSDVATTAAASGGGGAPDLAGLTPVGVRLAPEGLRLQWRLGNRLVETGFDRFRPVRLTGNNATGAVRVVWRDFGDLAMVDPFFRGTLDKAGKLSDRAGVFATDWEVLADLEGRRDNLPFSGAIFHMARTGSTLVHRLLSETGRVQSLSEPGIVDRALVVSADWPEIDRNTLLHGIIAAFARPRRQSEQHLVVKMTDAVPNMNLDQFGAAFPQVPWIFIYRDPVEVMVSLLREPSGTVRSWRRNPGAAAARIGMPGLAARSTSTEEFVARALGRFCGSAAAAARAAPPGRFLAVPYRRLPAAIWETIAPHFGITLSPEDRLAMQEKGRYSAKKKDTVEFQPDSEAKRREATQEMRMLAERHVGPAIAELAALPQG